MFGYAGLLPFRVFGVGRARVCGTLLLRGLGAVLARICWTLACSGFGSLACSAARYPVSSGAGCRDCSGMLDSCLFGCGEYYLLGCSEDCIFWWLCAVIARVWWTRACSVLGSHDCSGVPHLASSGSGCRSVSGMLFSCLFGVGGVLQAAPETPAGLITRITL